MIPCFIRLITSVVQRMSIVAMPMDPKLATSGLAQKTMVLKKQSKTKDLDPYEKARLILERHEHITKVKNNHCSSQMV